MSESPQEQWADLSDFPGYQISSIGRLRSVTRMVKSRLGMRVSKGRMHKIRRRPSGYAESTIRKNGRSQSISIAKAVIEAFGVTTSGNPPPPKSNWREERRTYCAWLAMVRRCTIPKNKYWHRYGGRGISVCPRWANSFPNFLEDMGIAPPGLTLDRVDNDGNYEPANCRWATKKQQSRNSTKARMLEWNGQRRCLVEWGELLGMKPSTILQRVTYGWSIDKALSTPVRNKP